MTPSGDRPRWEIAQMDPRRARALATEIEVSPLLAHLLIRRGAADPEAARRFLAPSLDQLSDPCSLEDMGRAVQRITRAREQGERVLVFGDYDVDGCASTALLVRALHAFGIEQCDAALPDRMSDGYGLNPDHVEAAAFARISLLITVDNGVRSHEAAQAARERGIDLIITDHHQLGDTLPEAYAVVNPMRQDPSHPAYHACGAGVAFRLATALLGRPFGTDLAALGTVADVVPLVGENRIIVAEGLRTIGERPGIRALARVADLDPATLRAEDLGFQLGPRINAAGRLGDAHASLDLLLSDDERESTRLARELDQANRRRREEEARMLEEAEALLEAHSDHPNSIVLHHPEWSQGIVGIVASRMQRRYNRPAILIAMGANGIGKGSARGVAGLDLSAVLAECSDHLVTFGGHQAAAGLTVESAELERFRARFDEAVAQAMPAFHAPPLQIDAQASLTNIDAGFVQRLAQLEPFGHGNPAIVLCTMNATLRRDALRVLRGGHLKLVVEEGGRAFDAIGFRMETLAEEIQDARAVDVAYTPQLNTWRGQTSVQLLLKDIRPAE